MQTPEEIYTSEEIETLRYKLTSLLEDYVKDVLSTKISALEHYPINTDSILANTAINQEKITDIAIDSNSYEEGESEGQREITVTLIFKTVTLYDLASSAQSRE